MLDPMFNDKFIKQLIKKLTKNESSQPKLIR